MILSRNTPISFADTGTFFSKRIRRIFPAYYLMIFAVLVVGRIYLISYDQRLLALDSGWTLAFLSNVHKYFQQKDYFAEVANYDFLLHAWSLAVEIQFYCVAPLFALIAHRLSLGKMLVATVAIGSFVVHVESTGELHFSSLPSRLWQFLAGSFAFEFHHRVSDKDLAVRSHVLSINGFSVLPAMACKMVAVIATFLISPVILFIPNIELLCRLTVTAAATLIVARISPSVNDFFISRTLLFIGDISYSLYLAHWPVIVFFRYIHHADQLLFRGKPLQLREFLLGNADGNLCKKNIDRNKSPAVIIHVGCEFKKIHSMLVVAHNAATSYILEIITTECASFMERCCRNGKGFSDCLILAQLSVLLAYLSFKTVEKYFIRENLLKALMFISPIFFSSIILMKYPNAPLLIREQQTDRSSITTLLNDGSMNETVEKTLFEKDCFAFHRQDYRPKTLTSSLLQNALVANERFMRYWPVGVPNDSLPDPLLDKYFNSKSIEIPFTAYYKSSMHISTIHCNNISKHRCIDE
uniref:Acyl_transf_3 domain-containing protein n=1 Tax=Ascaris lumbricoides TaxID=6252 RepID=A0A0M3I3E1_ASCLU